MLNWRSIVFIMFVLVIAGALYIRLRWRRAPQAYRAMIALALCHFIAGVLAGAWALHLTAPRSAEIASTTPSTPMAAPASGLAAVYLPNRYTGKVVSVTDGDTIDVALDLNGTVQSIRLAGIDAPEQKQTFGKQSTQHLSALVSGKAIAVNCDNERSYGRLICKILLPNGEDVALAQMKAERHGTISSTRTNRARLIEPLMRPRNAPLSNQKPDCGPTPIR